MDKLALRKLRKGAKGLTCGGLRKMEMSMQLNVLPGKHVRFPGRNISAAKFSAGSQQAFEVSRSGQSRLQFSESLFSSSLKLPFSLPFEEESSRENLRRS